jgi:hypothetical protein
MKKHEVMSYENGGFTSLIFLFYGEFFCLRKEMFKAFSFNFLKKKESQDDS